MRKMLFVLAFTALGLFSAQLRAQSGIWATAYYAGWMQGYNNTGYLPAQNIDYSAVTHIVHFALVPRSDGTLDDASNSVTAFNANEVVTRAHAAGKKVIITVGGWATDVAFRGATNSTNRAKFVANLVNLMQSRGYDGIDVDWEILASSDGPQFVAFITELRTALDAISPRPLLMAATAWQPSIFAQVHDKFDQINLMTYDLAGAWPGWVTWHNSATYDGGYNFPSTGRPVPSSDGMTNNFIAAGIPKSKLGIGIDFYGYIWNGGDGTPNGGATDPRQGWTTAPSVQSNVPYYTIMQNYYQPQYYRWDEAAQVSYLSIDNAGSTGDKFVSYDDEQTAKTKVDYARNKGIGGVIIWELGGGYRASLPAGQRDPLLQAVKQALGGSTPTPDTTPPTISISAPANGAALSGMLTLEANASDNIGVAGVQFKVNGANVGSEDISAPYSISWNSGLVANGSYSISATARDNAGNTSTASVDITVSNLSVDTTPPTVSLASPVNGATLSGTVTISASASDNIGVAGVQFKIDGANFGSELTVAPYSLSWNSTQVSNGSHSVSAVARDDAGNMTTSSVTVNVSNSTSTPPSSGDVVVFGDALQSPWINSSWSASVTFGSTEQKYAGTSSTKTSLTASWGALSLHHGNWGSAGINTGSYKTLEFAVYASATSTNLSIFFENDGGQTFPKVNYGTVPADQWTVVSIPMSQLNPNGQTVHRISIQEISGSAKTLYVDNYRFVGTAASSPSAPALSSPANGATGLAVNPTLSWNSSSGASSYRLQVSTSDAFTSIVVDQSSISGTSFDVSGLSNSTVYYWRVAATNGTGTSAWSSVSSFTTIVAAPASPVLASPANGAQGVTTTPTMSWNASANVSSYRLQISNGSAFAATMVDQGNITGTSYLASGLSRSTAYYWRVSATNASSTSGWSSVASFTTAAAPDTVSPTISITSPANGSTVSGNVSISANAADNAKLVSVQFKIDGINAGSELTAAPFAYSWNTSVVANGSHSITATARDSAGNQSTTSVSVTVSNTTVTPPSGDTWVYQDAVATPWIDASWSSTITFQSSERVYQGSQAIKVVQNAWGALRLHSGPWGKPGDINPSLYSSFEFAVFGGSVGLSVGMFFENDLNQQFPSVKYIWVAANQWKVISLPMSQLNPNNRVVHRVVIQDLSGRLRTYYVDNIRFVGKPQSASMTDAGSIESAKVVGAPEIFSLGQNYPNPFNPSTTITYALPKDANVTLEVFNALGQRISTLVDGVQSTGTHQAIFNASALPSGTYFYRIQAQTVDGNKDGSFTIIRKMSLLK